MNATNSFDYNILVRVLNGYASAEDQATFNDWVQDADNQAEFDFYRVLWDKTKVETPKALVDVAADWQKVAPKLQGQKQAVFRTMPLWAAGLAASIILLVVAYFAFNGMAPTDSVREIALSDGTKVWLNRNANLDFPSQFADNNRTVTLTGEAFFEVKEDQKRPFIVKAKHSEVRVLGTSFNIKTYNSLTEVTVEEGSVQLAKAEGEPILLGKSERGTADEFALRKEANPNPNYASWRTGIFQFDATRLSQVAFDLATYYDKPIRIQDAPDCLLTATFEQEQLATVLEVLEHSCQLEAIKRKGEIILRAVF